MSNAGQLKKTCPKCGGLLFEYATYVDDFHPDGDWAEYETTSCIACKHIVRQHVIHCSESSGFNDHYDGVRREVGSFDDQEHWTPVRFDVRYESAVPDSAGHASGSSSNWPARHFSETSEPSLSPELHHTQQPSPVPGRSEGYASGASSDAAAQHFPETSEPSPSPELHHTQQPSRVSPRSAARQPKFYSCFISYSTKDQVFARRLVADLDKEGVTCWYAEHDVVGGRKLHEQIEDAIQRHDKLLLILSAFSMHSEWVRTEIAKARKRELREGCRMLFPISLVPFEMIRDWECFDGDTGKDSAREVREYYIPDFSNWKTDADAYNQQLDRVVKSLTGNSVGDTPHA